jgi:ADP-heptose:LPS heptosyltransferase
MRILPKEYVIVQTAGAHKMYRTYDHMGKVFAPEGRFDFPYPLVQIGSATDPLCPGVVFDFREKLSYRESAAVVAAAKAAVVIDSFPSHLCGACGTPAVVLYGPAPARVTKPRSDNARMIHIEPDRLHVCPVTSTCWGAPFTRPCKVPCINTIDPKEVRNALNTILGDVK